jgi:exodeoxyribonuclease VII large subunit
MTTAARTLSQRLRSGAVNQLQGLRAELKNLSAQLGHLNPGAVLERGYSIAETADGKFVRDAAQLRVNDDLRVTFARGAVRARVTGKSGDGSS